MRACVGILPGVLTGLLLAVSSGVPAGAVPQNEVRAAASASQTQAIRQFTTQYCVSCPTATGRSSITRCCSSAAG